MKKICITGGHGLIGSHLAPYLKNKGHEVIILTRELPVTECDVVINLAGENIASRWTTAKKRAIYESRIDTTKCLVEKLNKLQSAPLLISTSAVGYYGNSDEQTLIESSDPGSGFLASVCCEWESAANKYSGPVATPRFGAVLTPNGGMLKKILLPFKLCLGGVVGSGKQYMSWIAIDDLLRAIVHIIDSNLTGAYNLTAPAPVTNETFTRVLADHLKRPALCLLPTFVVKLLFGQMGEELLLSSSRAIPQNLEESGFHFRYPELEDALEHLL